MQTNFISKSLLRLVSVILAIDWFQN